MSRRSIRPVDAQIAPVHAVYPVQPVQPMPPLPGHAPAHPWWEHEQVWSEVAMRLREAHAVQQHQNARLRDSWVCSRATSYLQHSRPLVGELELAAQLAAEVAHTYRELAQLIDSTPIAVPDHPVMVAHAVGADARLVSPGEAELDEEKRRIARRLSSLIPEFAALHGRWRGQAISGTPEWDVPRGNVAGVQVTSMNGTTVVSTGNGDDRIRVHTLPDGSTEIVVVGPNGTHVTRTVPPGQEILINTGGGDDQVIVGDHVPNRVRIVGDEGMRGTDEPELVLGQHLPVSLQTDAAAAAAGDDETPGGLQGVSF